ncbi:MAG: 3-hydroxyacyl-CoA dehydrogenase NAD-binding domain-containing protein [Burkholderiaceae bacterium]
MSKGSAVIVGSGIMGTGIAALFVRAGWRTQMLARRPEAWPGITGQVARLVGQLAAQPGAADQAAPLEPRATLEAIDWEGVDLVIETVAENKALKQQVFADLDRLVPAGVPIGTNTSGMRVSELAKHCGTRERMAHAHFFMPAHLVPLVELAKADFTTDETLDKMQAAFTAIGRVPVRINSDVPGLLANRIQHALMREAFSIVQQGLATTDDVDLAVRFGFGFRYVAAGPILQKEFSGLDTQLASGTAIYPSLCNDTEPARVLRDVVAAGHLGVKTGRGFREWSKEAAGAERARYERALLDAAALLMRDGLPKRQA